MQNNPQYGERIEPPKHVARNFHVSSFEEYRKLYEQSVNSPEEFWAEQAKTLSWFRPWDKVLSHQFSDGEVSWFEGGMLNVAYNCIDRHLPHRAEQTAIIWEMDEPDQDQHITYKELHYEVSRTANALKTAGVKKGDRVVIYLPMIPELAYTMLACARIGAVHSIVFAGFSADALRDRILDCSPKVVITANEGCRGGKKIPLKDIVNKALQGLDIVETVFVAKRTDTPVHMQPLRDIWLDQAVAKERGYCPCEWMASEDPLFILYTSGSTGKPKGLLHSQAGYLLHTSLTHKYVFNYQEGDVYCCAADIGWVTGHSYVIYGPLANGATTVMFESTPLYPHSGRYWQMIEKHKINIFYTAPTAIRAILCEGDGPVKKFDRSSLRVLGSVGEPINPEAWRWYFEVVSDSLCPIVDTWWQTETGGILISPLPGIITLKPGSATLPFFGVQPCLMDEEGRILNGNGTNGLLCIKYPWPGMARTIYGDHQRFRETYFSKFRGFYFTGDGCRRDEDGYYWITGRVDDVINVAGHRLGTAEIESSLVNNHLVAEAAVVGVPHEVKGTAIFAFVILKKEVSGLNEKEIEGILKEQVRNDISPIATPEQIMIAPGLPKTRSGKIMRRILKKISIGDYEDMGNITTLADPSVVEALIEKHKKLLTL